MTNILTRKGRPRKSEGPSFPIEQVDQLLVHGELVIVTEGKPPETRFPSMRELARRFEVSHTVIAEYAKQHNCILRRRQAKQRVQELADTKLIELRAEVLAVTRDDQLRIIDRYLVAFEEALKDGRVRIDNPTDYNTMCRLKLLLLGEADSRQEHDHGMPTLEELQARHQAMLKTLAEATPERCGMVLSRHSVVATPEVESDEV